MATDLQLTIQAALTKVRGQESFLSLLLTGALGWQIGDPQNVDDVSYSWSAEDLRASGLAQKVVDSRIWQIQPLAKGQPWGIFVLQFKHPDAFTTGRSMTGVLRQVLRGLVAARTKSAALASWQREDLLFICTHAWQHYVFVHFAQPKEKGRAARLTSFGWSPDSPNRTLIQENLPHLEWPDDVKDAAAWREKWLRAFDKEKLSREFFREYDRVFHNVESLIEGIPNAERKRLFTQRLFNRLMFIAFIQKKGWLSFDGNTDYLSAFWNGYQQGGCSENSPPQMRRGGAPSDGVVLSRKLSGDAKLGMRGDQEEKDKRRNFYADRLKRLFFHGLSTAGEVDIIGINRGGDLKATIGKVPYLNGGLFEEVEDDKDSTIHVPDEAIGAVLNELFNRFNFTVMESTPLDVEVAVDPEMLGKVFEELVTGRHETGSYYTPKPVVSFMCREALKGYLCSQLPSETPESIERFVEEHNPEGLRNPEPVLEALRKVKVCDPACGSGAYLLGMLHELLDLRTCLFATRKLDAISNFARKLQIIQNNLYGVDLDVFAVNIARLRLWLSLAVEYEGDNPPPLPNLDFKIETGDSLTVPAPSGGLDQGFRKPLIDEYLKLKAEFLTAHHGRKIELRKQIDQCRETIRGWARAGGAVDGFDWGVDFAEVFLMGGFDVILANPPFVRADAPFNHIQDEEGRQHAIANWREYRTSLAESGVYETLYEKWDLYIPFLERAFQLLATSGRMTYIVSDSYCTAKYARKSHSFFLTKSWLERIDFCSDIDLFDAGINNVIIHFSKKEGGELHTPVRVRRWQKSKRKSTSASPPSTAYDLDCRGEAALDCGREAAALGSFPNDRASKTGKTKAGAAAPAVQSSNGQPGASIEGGTRDSTDKSGSFAAAVQSASRPGKVYINAQRWFEGVPENVWNFHIGGYQVCEKWLKDRRGRVLSEEDIAHYQKIVVALKETIRLMAEIDKVIEAHGGWPGAFVTK